MLPTDYALVLSSTGLLPSINSNPKEKKMSLWLQRRSNVWITRKKERKKESKFNFYTVRQA